MSAQEAPDGTNASPASCAHEASAFAVYSVKEISEDVVKLASSAGSFFLRCRYLEKTAAAQLFVQGALGREEAEDCIQAAFAYSAERAAVAHLVRCEHSVFMLKRKLLAKGHSEEAAQKALEYLRERGFASDERFAAAFLRSRAISHSEGRARLMAELSRRGVERQTAEAALDEFFGQNPEDALLERAAQKCARQGKTPEQTQQALVRLGFSWKQIRQYFKNRREN